MNKEMIKQIKEWIVDYELCTYYGEADGATLDGSAYLLFNKILEDNKKCKKCGEGQK